MDKEEMTIEEIIATKPIKEVEITGFGLYITFKDGSQFEYNASDGGYSSWDYTESQLTSKTCSNCIHEKVCDLWRANEHQDAECYSENEYGNCGCWDSKE